MFIYLTNVYKIQLSVKSSDLLNIAVCYCREWWTKTNKNDNRKTKKRSNKNKWSPNEWRWLFRFTVFISIFKSLLCFQNQNHLQAYTHCLCSLKRFMLINVDSVNVPDANVDELKFIRLDALDDTRKQYFFRMCLERFNKKMIFFFAHCSQWIKHKESLSQGQLCMYTHMAFRNFNRQKKTDGSNLLSAICLVLGSIF